MSDLPNIYKSDKVRSDCRIIQEAASKQAGGFFGLTLNHEQSRHVAFALLVQIDSLEEGYEAHEPEVQDAIRCLREVQGNLARATKKHATQSGNAKGGAASWGKDSDVLFDKETAL